MQTTEAPDLRRNPVLQTILVAAAYYLTGRLGLFLAIPPGFATAVWPPSGIALAGILLCGSRCWPGVFVGSFLINVFTAFDTTSAQSVVQSCAIAGSIALGASLQAVVSAWLARRYGGWPGRLERPKEVAAVLFWGGLVGCLINPSLSTTLLTSVGAQRPENFGFHWFTWWVGDTLGVLAFTPSILLLFSPKENQPSFRKLIASVSLLVVFGVAVVIFIVSAKMEKEQRHDNFIGASHQIAKVIENNLKGYLQILSSTKNYFEVSDRVTLEDFRRFAADFYVNYPGIVDLSWSEKVPLGDRPAYVARMRRLVRPDFDIYDRGPDGKTFAAPARAVYFPVTFISTPKFEKQVPGFDTYGKDVFDGIRRSNAKDQARDDGTMHSTGLIRVLNQPGRQGILFYVPVYKSHAPADTVERRRQNLTGYLACVLIVPRLIEASFAVTKGYEESVAFKIVNMEETGNSEILYDTEKGAPLPAHAETETVDVPVGHATWQLIFTLKPPRGPEQYNWRLWLVLIRGLFSTCLLSAFVLILTGQTSAVQREVQEKTQALKELTEKLIRSNTELERFAYVASHDMQEPVRMIASFSSLLASEKMRGAHSEKEMRYIGFVTEAASRLQAMIEDLLDYARLGNASERFVTVDMGKKLRYALQNSALAIEDAQAKIDYDELPRVTGSAAQLTRLLQNLINNSLRYQREGVPPHIRIGAADAGSDWLFSVQDNGKGIPPEYIPKIFEPFKRLHSWHEKRGTGLGLAICKTIVENHGGEIWAVSTPGEGSTFFFTLPKEPDKENA